MNSTLYVVERFRQRERLPGLTKAQHDLSDALSLLVETQLSAEALLRLNPHNSQLRVLKTFLDRELIRLDKNIRDAAIEDGEQS